MPLMLTTPRKHVGRFGGYGWRRDTPNRRDRHYAPKHAAPLPQSVDLRKLSYTPAVYDQGDIGSCTGNSGAGLVQFLRGKLGLTPFEPSRLFIYWNARMFAGDEGQDGGAQIRDMIEGLNTCGAPPEKDWPYDTSQVLSLPPAQAFDDAALDVALDPASIPQELDAVCSWLAGGRPFPFGFTVYESFESDAVAVNGVVPMPGPDEQIMGGHAVDCWGYDLGAKVAIVRNSWGADWGDEGYFYMPFDYLLDPQLASDFWAVTELGKEAA